MAETEEPKMFMPLSSLGFVESLEATYPKSVFQTLLKDRTTGKNIIWADDEYEAMGSQYLRYNEITIPKISGNHSDVIKPRTAKELEKQSLRTKTHAEVFTPAWLVNQMNGYMDDEWFGREQVFSSYENRSWKSTTGAINFDDAPGTWKEYVDQRRLEITCGEAPFITTRYDMLTGDAIEVADRVGFLDRKLRVVSENTNGYDEWLTWAFRALEATYGYEYQGDNLLIARINVLQAFAEAMQATWDKQPDEKEALKAARITSWNIWQMDGLKGTVPVNTVVGDNYQMSLFELIEDKCVNEELFCRVRDWRSKITQTYILMTA